MLLALALRLYSLGQQSYWIDEMVSLHFAKHANWRAIFWDNTPFTYQLLLKGWVGLFGDSEVATRALSVLFSLGATYILFLLGNLIFGFYGGLIFAFFQAVSPLSIVYAQEARMYAMFEFFMTLNLHYFYGLMKRRSDPHRSKGFLIASFGMIMTHYLAWVPLLIEGVWILFSKTPKISRKKIVIGLAVGVGLFGLCCLVLISWRHLAWQNLKYNVEPESHYPGLVIWDLMNQSWVSAAAFAILFLNSVYLFIKKRQEGKDHFFFLFFVFAPLVIFIIFTFVLKRSVFLPRYFIYLIPFFVAWAGSSFMDIFARKKWAAAFLLAVLIYGSITSISQAYLELKAPWRDAAKVVAQHKDSVVFTSRSIAIEVPYFERIGVKVEKWDQKTNGAETIQEKLKLVKNVWLVENYWGGKDYMAALKPELKKLKLDVAEFILQTDVSDPILIMQIH